MITFRPPGCDWRSAPGHFDPFAGEKPATGLLYAYGTVTLPAPDLLPGQRVTVRGDGGLVFDALVLEQGRPIQENRQVVGYRYHLMADGAPRREAAP